MALTRDQEDLISRVKSWLREEDKAARKEAGTTAAKLMAAMKNSDRPGRGYLTGRDIADCLSRVGLPRALLRPG